LNRYLPLSLSLSSYFCSLSHAYFRTKSTPTQKTLFLVEPWGL
jgi:hypothetical protein